MCDLEKNYCLVTPSGNSCASKTDYDFCLESSCATNSLEKQIASQVLQMIADDDPSPKDQANIRITITNSYLDSYMQETMENDCVVQMGLHHFIVLPNGCSNGRMEIECTALFMLHDISSRWMAKHPNVSAFARARTDESLVIAVCYKSFRRFQCFLLGISALKNLHSSTQLFETFHLEVYNEDYGTIRMPTSAHKDLLALMTQWTSSITAAYNIKEVYDFRTGLCEIDVQTAKLNPRKMYFQLATEWLRM
jgi:hypothetical protein